MILDNTKNLIGQLSYIQPQLSIYFCVQDKQITNSSDISEIADLSDQGRILALDLGTGKIGNGRLVGFLEASIRPFVEDCHSDHVGYLEGWFVESDFRQRGIGKNLVKAAENWARSKGCEEMASDSEIGNELSLRAHLGLGYEETSRLVHLRKDLV